MAQAERMSLAVLDPFDNVIYKADDTRIAVSAIAARAAQKATARKVGRWPFRRTVEDLPEMEEAIRQGIHDALLRPVARM